MTGNMFKNKFVALSFTDPPLPYFKYNLFGFIQMNFLWNQYMRSIFHTLVGILFL